MIAREDIVITGIGLACPAGDSAESTWAALLRGAAITDHSRAMLTPSPQRGEGGGEERDAREPTVLNRAGTSTRASFDDRIFLASGTPLPSPQPSPRWGEGAGDRLVDLGHRVSIEAIEHTGWNRNVLADARTALIVGTSKGPADDWLVPIELAFEPPTSDKEQCQFVTSRPSVATESSVRVNPARPIKRAGAWRNPTAQPGLHGVSEMMADRLDFGFGPRLTFSAACASSLHALIRAAMLLEHGDADRAIVVGTESSLHGAFIQSFKRLGVLAAAGEMCRPFDRNRSGFLIAEAAAAVCLERRPARAGEIVLDGCALGGDASHLTGTDPNAVALRRCLAKVIAARPVDLIHAHATGTIANDPIELAAIEASIESAVQSSSADRPILYSHKGAMGHSLGASGMVAAVLNVMAHRACVVPGNVNTTDPLSTRAGRIETNAIERPIRRSVAIAAGFGGATGVVGLRTAE